MPYVWLLTCDFPHTYAAFATVIDALIVAMDVMQQQADKGEKRIVLFTSIFHCLPHIPSINSGNNFLSLCSRIADGESAFNDDNVDAIVAGLKQMGVHLQVVYVVLQDSH